MTAASTTPLKPICMANTVASTALTTEAQPLMAQAQGTSPGAVRANSDSPSGNGMPIQNARGTIAPIAQIHLIGSGQGKAHWKKTGNTGRDMSAQPVRP